MAKTYENAGVNLEAGYEYHSSAYAVVEACTKVACAGADYSGMRFSYQEYFERMTKDPHTWGKPLSALLGTLKMQKEFGLASIGGKDSMSGTFEHIHVPPTLVAFGITTVDARRVISSCPRPVSPSNSSVSLTKNVSSAPIGTPVPWPTMSGPPGTTDSISLSPVRAVPPTFRA